MKPLATLLALTAIAAADPAAIIYDIGNDVDDVLALGMIHSLQSRGHCDLLAVTVTKDHPLAAAFSDSINTFYGRPDVPIGAVRNGATPEQGKFNGLANEKNPDGTLRYPHDLMSGADAPEATGLLRKLLAGRPDKSVSLVQVGFFTNYRRLLESKPDDIPPLTGRPTWDLTSVLAAVWPDRDDFPHSAKPDTGMPDALAIYRKALASAPDGSVVICSVGALSNLEDLLRSRPDDRSPLPGAELVRTKVKNTVIMEDLMKAPPKSKQRD